MFEASKKPTGTVYTPTIAFLVLAFIFSPAILVVTRPFGYISVMLAIACSVACLALAWLSWKKFAEVPASSVSIPKTVAK